MKTNAFFRWNGQTGMAVLVLLALFLVIGPAGMISAQDFEVYADIRPCNCPNPLNLFADGILPVAISVTGGYGVEDIDQGSIKLEGVSPIGDPPLEPQIRDITNPYSSNPQECDDCWAEGPDGADDLLLFFDAAEVVDSLPPDTEDGDCVFLEVTGQFNTSNGPDEFAAGDNVLIHTGAGKKQKP